MGSPARDFAALGLNAACGKVNNRLKDSSDNPTSANWACCSELAAPESTQEPELLLEPKLAHLWPEQQLSPAWEALPQSEPRLEPGLLRA